MLGGDEVGGPGQAAEGELADCVGSKRFVDLAGFADDGDAAGEGESLRIHQAQAQLAGNGLREKRTERADGERECAEQRQDAKHYAHARDDSVAEKLPDAARGIARAPRAQRQS